MTEKHLADLLQNSPDSETEAIQQVAPDQPLELNTTVSETEPLDETTAEPSSVDTAAALGDQRTDPTKAELETTVIELREGLQAAYSKENSLQQQIANLQSDLQEQKILVQKLQADLEQTNQIKAEFEQAKKVFLQLSETSAKTTQKANNTRKESEHLKPQKLALKKLPHQSIQPDSPTSNISEVDVTWVD